MANIVEFAANCHPHLSISPCEKVRSLLFEQTGIIDGVGVAQGRLGGVGQLLLSILAGQFVQLVVTVGRNTHQRFLHQRGQRKERSTRDRAGGRLVKTAPKDR